MSEIARSVVIEYLLGAGWRQAASGGLGELWRRGAAETVVPHKVDAGSQGWIRLAQSVAAADDRDAGEVLAYLDSRIQGRSSLSDNKHARAGRGRVELEIHLDGPRVNGHETSAFEFGSFVMRTADAVKELAKSSRGTKWRTHDLLVVGGPSEGSVTVTFREPDRSDGRSLFEDAPETAEGQALAFLSGVLIAAEAGATRAPASSDVNAYLAPLRAQARRGIARMAEATANGGWVLDGVIRRGDSEDRIEFGPLAARLLWDAAREEVESARIETMPGTIDGWVWSRSELWLIPEDGGREVRVSVPVELSHRVGELNAVMGTRVRARLAVYRGMTPGMQDTVRTSYSLISIESIEPDLLTVGSE